MGRRPAATQRRGERRRRRLAASTEQPPLQQPQARQPCSGSFPGKIPCSPRPVKASQQNRYGQCGGQPPGHVCGQIGQPLSHALTLLHPSRNKGHMPARLPRRAPAPRARAWHGVARSSLCIKCVHCRCGCLSSSVQKRSPVWDAKGMGEGRKGGAQSPPGDVQQQPSKRVPPRRLRKAANGATPLYRPPVRRGPALHLYTPPAFAAGATHGAAGEAG